MLHNNATLNLPSPLQKKQFNNKSLLVYLRLQLIFCYTKAVLLLAKGERKVTSVTSRSNLRWLPVRISIWSDRCQRLSTLKNKYYQRLLPTQIHTHWAHQLMNLEWIFSHILKTSDCVNADYTNLLPCEIHLDDIQNLPWLEVCLRRQALCFEKSVLLRYLSLINVIIGELYKAFCQKIGGEKALLC